MTGADLPFLCQLASIFFTPVSSHPVPNNGCSLPHRMLQTTTNLLKPPVTNNAYRALIDVHFRYSVKTNFHLVLLDCNLDFTDLFPTHNHHNPSYVECWLVDAISSMNGWSTSTDCSNTVPTRNCRLQFNDKGLIINGSVVECFMPDLES